MELRPAARELSVIWHPHPVCPAAGREVRPHQWRHGQTVREVLLANGVDPHAEIVVSLNDRPLTVAEWDLVCPADGDILNVQAVTSGGGGGGSNPLRIILTIAVIYVAWQYGPALGKALGLSGAAATAVGGAIINVAGSLLINAIAPPPKPEFGSINGSRDSSSPTYSLAGGSNRLRPYEPLPVLMGQHIIFPDAGSKPFTEYQGEDQYLYQIFNFGLSDLVLDGFRIGDTPVTSFTDVKFVWPDNNGKLPGFPSNVDTTSGGALESGGDWVIRTSSPGSEAISVDVEGIVYYAGPGGLIEVKATVGAEYRAVGDTTWLPMASRTVTEYGTHYWSRGYYVDMGDSGTYWQQVAYGSTTEADHTDGENAGAWGGNYYDVGGYSTIWRWRPYSEILTSGDGSALRAPAPPQPTTVSSLAEVVIEHGATQKPKRKSLRVDVPVGQYEVRVKLVGAYTMDGTPLDTELSEVGVNYQFTALRSYQVDSTSYQGQKRLGLIIKASGQLNGAVQQLSAVGKASCVHWGTYWKWHGLTYKRATGWMYGPTSNPAWWFLDFARGRKNAAGKLVYGCGLPDAQIDIAAIEAWAIFCDEQGLTFDAVLDQQQTAGDVLNTIARCGFGSPSWSTGKLGAVWDAPNQAPVAAFGMSNIVKGSFSVDYITDSLADEITVSYIDRGSWSQQQVRALTPGTTTPSRPTSVDLKGCTSKAMAGKFANALAAQQEYRRRTITWDCDVEGFVCQRGDVVVLSHDLTQWGYSGRLVSKQGRTLKLDRKVPRNGQVEYLMLKRPNGTMATGQVDAGEGESDTVLLSSDLPLQDGELPVDHIWFFSPLATPGKRVKLLNVKPLSESRVRVQATDESPEFYTAWGGVFEDVVSLSLLPSNQPSVTAVAFSEQLVRAGAGFAVQLTATLDVSGHYSSSRFRLYVGGVVVQEGVLAGEVLSALTADSGAVRLELVPYNPVGQPGQPAFFTYSLVGKAYPPARVTGLTVQVVADRAILSWSANPDVDLEGYEIRYGASWAGSAFVGYGNTTTFKIPALAVGTHTWRVKAKDTSKNYSNLDSTVSLTVVAPSVYELAHSFVDTVAVLSWSAEEGTWPTDYYEVRYGASWAAGALVERVKALSTKVAVSWTGSRTFWVAPIDVAGNVGAAASVLAAVIAPSAPSLAVQFAGENAVLTWTASAGSLPVLEYEVRYGGSWAGGVVLGRVKGSTFSLRANWTGARTFWAAGVTANEVGAAGSIVATVTPPSAVSITPETVDNNVLLRWSESVGTLPIAEYRFKRNGALIGTVSARFATVFESSSGTYTYTVEAVDSAGNIGAAASASAVVSQPPDFVLYADADSAFDGTKTNGLLVDGVLIANVDTAETWAQHFVSRGWSSPQDQINAGYPGYLVGKTTGSYVETVDYGTTVPSTKVTLTPTEAWSTGTVTQTPTLSTSLTNLAGSFTDFAGVWSAYSTAFRYVKYEVNFSAAHTGTGLATDTANLVAYSKLNRRLDVKLKTVQGEVPCLAADAGGTAVDITGKFIDVQAITITPKGTSPLIALYDFVDAPNPTSFKILLFTTAGARANGTASYTIRGV